MEHKPYSYHGIVTQYSFHIKRKGKSEFLGFGSFSTVKEIGSSVVGGKRYTQLGMAMIANEQDLFIITMPGKDADKLISDFNKWKKGKAK